MTPLPMSGLPSLDGSSFDDPFGGGGLGGEIEIAPIDHLSGLQKAAILVQALVQEGAELNLEQLPEELQMRLIREIGSLGHVEDPVVAAVKIEFAEKLKKTGLSGASGLKRALDLLGNSLSTGLAQRLRAQTGTTQIGDPWERIGEKDAEELLQIIENESLEVAAVILSKLSVAKAAELLGLMPGERARKITYAISLTSAVTPDVTKRVGKALAGMLAIQPPRAFDEGPVERVGAILNYSRAATRNTVLEGLDETDKGFAEEVRRAIFTFGNIPERIDPRDIPKVVRQVDQDVLIKALAASLLGDLKEAAEFLLGGLSQRMAESLKGEIEDLGAVEEEVGEEAMGEVVTAIRELEANGEIYLVAPED
ncbi:MAG: FliG C-terminal domain-containing protein [Pseudomonadota bacterium]